MKKRRRRCNDSSSDRVHEILQALRHVQTLSNCATSTLNLVLKYLQPFLKGCEHVQNLKMERVRARKQSRFKRCLNGCVGCNDHVFGPASRDKTCPKCGHARFDAQGKPHEVCWFFPLREQIRSLIQMPHFRECLMYEKIHRRLRRCHSDNFMCDIFDSPRWQEFAGPPGNDLNRIVLHGCVDGCPMFDHREQVESAKPLQYFFINLPPWLRYKLQYMLVHALIPAELKGQSAKKYYDWFGTEMTDLSRNGVDGVRIKLYGTTLDTPGRRELLNMQAVTAFYPCPHCLHTWQPGLRSQVYGGYRRFLSVGSPWRQKTFRFNGQLYQFRDVEQRPPPALRTDRNVQLMAARGTPARPFLGHKGKHFMETWEGVDWEGSLCDKMHDLKLLCEMFLKGLVGSRSSNGMYKSWATKKKDSKHRDDCIAFDIFPEFHAADSSPPWRLSVDELHMCDMRVRAMWWPSYMDRLAYKGHSFWTHSDRIWKASHKAFTFLVILPTCLIGCVPAVHQALLTLVSGIRHLEGQVVCAHEAKARHLIPGVLALLVWSNFYFLVRSNFYFLVQSNFLTLNKQVRGSLTNVKYHPWGIA